ncbi:hypothetical protein [Hymenobacter sp. AT01-02]|nr:hypothetical protein [Hymenobacter sp. AT01-02]
MGWLDRADGRTVYLAIHAEPATGRSADERLAAGAAPAPRLF